ncbi:DUF4269 domain-containing protein [Pedobacter sp.]|jgi:hypothetical protein|uniref:DUF4269 domain-containing protein n=1 Tax=Pedobacter sp. TaxID=1411316 RepID=UPI0035666F2E
MDLILNYLDSIFPTTQQYGYLHLVIEDRLLSEKGEAFKKEIVRLKKGVLKNQHLR